MAARGALTLLTPQSTRMRVDLPHESFLNYNALLKREQELHESWLHITACIAKTLVNSYQNLNQRSVDESCKSRMFCRSSSLSVCTQYFPCRWLCMHVPSPVPEVFGQSCQCSCCYTRTCKFKYNVRLVLFRYFVFCLRKQV